MKNLFFAFALLLTVFSAQAQITGMSVHIAGPSTGTAFSATVVRNSNSSPSGFNGYGVSCADAGTGNNSNGAILVTATGGSANYTYELYTGAAISGSPSSTATASATTNNFTGLLGKIGAGQSYTAKVTDANGCIAVIASPTVAITAADSLKANLSAALPADLTDFCQTDAGKITVNITGGVKTGSLGAGAGYDITWTAPVGSFTNGFTGPAGGTPTGAALANTSGTQLYSGLSGNVTYIFVVTDDNGCVVQ